MMEGIVVTGAEQFVADEPRDVVTTPATRMKWKKNKVAIAIVMGMRAEEAPYSAIADAINTQFNCAIKKPAVCGIVSRISAARIAEGLPPLEKRRTVGPSHFKKARSPKVVGPKKEPPLLSELERERLGAIFDAAIPKCQKKSLMDLGPSDCRWPLGDPGRRGFAYCGAAVAKESYCEHHWMRSRAAPRR